MPTVWRERGLRFFFYSEERNEPPHIHVESGDHRYAKMWLGPPVAVAYWRGDFSPREFPIPDKLRTALANAIARGETNYPSTPGMAALREPMKR